MNQKVYELFRQARPNIGILYMGEEYVCTPIPVSRGRYKLAIDVIEHGVWVYRSVFFSEEDVLQSYFDDDPLDFNQGNKE